MNNPLVTFCIITNNTPINNSKCQEAATKLAAEIVTVADLKSLNYAIQHAKGEFVVCIKENEHIATQDALIEGISFVKQNNFVVPNTNLKIGAISVNVLEDKPKSQAKSETRIIVRNTNIGYTDINSLQIDDNTLKINDYYIVESNIDIKQETSAISSNNKLLSVCMIVKNEENMLVGCLQSVQNIVDEIIIVDTGSTDKTLEIAEQFHANIYHFPWNDDFAEARNESIKHSTAQWILYLDADERLMPNSQKQIRQLLETANDETGAYFCTIESNHRLIDGNTEKHRGGYPRLFKNLKYPNIHFVGRVHEQISPSITAMQKNLIKSDIIIEHLGYNISAEKMNEKVQRNYRMLIAHVTEEPTNGYAWFQLGQTLGQMQLYEQAEEAILFAIRCGDLKRSVSASAAATLSQFNGRKKNFAEALHWAEESLRMVPNQLYGLSLKAHSLLYLGRKQEAEKAFLQAIQFMKTNKEMPRSGFDIDISEELLMKGLAECSNKVRLDHISCASAQA